jgi:nucleoside-diphosphate-sugar epimerase
MTTLITGGGLVGARAAEQVLERGDDVVLFDVAPNRALLGPAAERMTIVRGDLLLLPELLAAVRQYRPERILHTAGLLTPAGQERPYFTVQVNVVGTTNVLEAARLEGVRRVVLCSSGTVYASEVETPGGVMTEDHPAAPATVYAATKLACEQIGNGYASLFGFEFLSVRFAAVYGPAFTPGGGVTRVIHDALTAALTTGQARVRRRWQGRMELVYSADAAAGLVAAGFAPAPAHNVFNIGSGELTSADDVAAMIAEFTGAQVEVVEPQGLAESNPRARLEAAYDLSRAGADIGYQPRYTLQRGIRELADWLRAHRP